MQKVRFGDSWILLWGIFRGWMYRNRTQKYLCSPKIHSINFHSILRTFHKWLFIIGSQKHVINLFRKKISGFQGRVLVETLLRQIVLNYGVESKSFTDLQKSPNINPSISTDPSVSGCSFNDWESSSKFVIFILPQRDSMNFNDSSVEARDPDNVEKLFASFHELQN